LADELLEMSGSNMQMDSLAFPSENDTIFLFPMFPRFRRLYLTRLVELRSWRFFDGSID
jgi:hypothetical protein